VTSAAGRTTGARSSPTVESSSITVEGVLMAVVPPGPQRRTGIAAVSAGVLLFGSVAGELVHQVQRPDGTVTEPVLFAVLLGAWTLGAGALIVAIAGISAARDRCDERRRVAGRRTSLVGAGLLCAFGLAVLVAGLVSGRPVEASFLLFALGLLLTAVGQTMLALGLRRTGSPGRWSLALLVAAAAALAAVLVFSDPWHDLALFTFDAAWVALGLRLLHGRLPARRRVHPGTALHA
jgi:hypothetical protein